MGEFDPLLPRAGDTDLLVCDPRDGDTDLCLTGRLRRAVGVTLRPSGGEVLWAAR